MPPKPKKSNTILPNEFMVGVLWPSGRCVRRVEQIIRGHVTSASVAAVFASVRSELRITEPAAAAC
jgi:hypothetical protein